MHEDEMRNMILADIIDKMHGRMADKMFPPDPSHDDMPAVTGLTMDGHTEDGHDIPAEPTKSGELAGDTKMEMHGDDKGDDHGIPEDEPSEDELDEMMKGMK